MRSLLASISSLLALPATRQEAPLSPSSAWPVYHPSPDPRTPFSRAVRVGDIIYVSGQIGFLPDGTLPKGIAAQTKAAMANLSAALAPAGASIDDVFKCTVMLTDISHWDEFNKVYVTYFKRDRLPARSAFAAAGLVAGAVLELECLAYAPAAKVKSK